MRLLTFSQATRHSLIATAVLTASLTAFAPSLTRADNVGAATVETLFADRTLPEPLVPVGIPTIADNEAVSLALRSLRDRKHTDDFSALETFLEKNPGSAWELAVRTNLGLLQYDAGYFSRCISTYFSAWSVGKSVTEPKAKALADRAAGEYVKMLARLGRLEHLKQFLTELGGRQFTGSATELIAAGIEGSTFMELHPERAYRCGPLALGRILANAPSSLAFSPILNDAPSTAQGIAIIDVAKLSEKIGLNYQVAKRLPGAQIITPSVVHWKAGHYAALIRAEKGRYLTEDPTFENHTWHSQDALEDEASGYFLIPSGPLPKGWTTVSETEASRIFGKGTTSGCTSTQTAADLMTCTVPHPPPSGMASYNFRIMLASLQLADTPVGYSPPVGYPVPFSLVYAQRDDQQPTNLNFPNVGRKWGFNWQSYIKDTPGNPQSVSVVSAGGVVAAFAAPVLRDGYYNYPTQFETRKSLRGSATEARYEITNPDGSKEIYANSDGSASSPRRIFLSQLIDASGNTTTLAYDSLLRLTEITDAIGQKTKLTYGTEGAARFQISTVTNPFGRAANFSYDDAGRLVSIKDVIGIESRFGYDGASDFINRLTTPYGTTTFTTSLDGLYRRLTATDPAGDTEVLETINIPRRTDFGIDAVKNSEASMPQIPGIGQHTNENLQLRNSYYWDKKQWKEAKGDYTRAHIYHWLHDRNFTQMSPYLESEKSPLESRVFYVYAGQPSGVEPGTMTVPSASGRVVEGGSQVVSRTLNDLGKPLSETDPVGRTTRYSYSPDGVDLLSVSRDQPGGAATLTRYSYNAQHLPLTLTDASGQTTRMTYNALGQLLTVTNAKGETTTFTYYDADAPGKQRKARLATVDGPLRGTADTTTLDYTAEGNIASTTSPDGYTLLFTYDKLDRPTRVTFPDATYTETTYLALDPKTSRDRLGRITTYIYNSLRQLVSVTDPANRTTLYQWCKCGSLAQLVDAMGRVTKWKYDVAGHLVAKEYTDGSSIAYDYEPLSGRLSTITDEKAQKKNYSYNLDDTLARVSYANARQPTAAVAYSYDTSFRRLTRMVDGIGTTNYTYNQINDSPSAGAGMLASVDGPWANDTITYGYDVLGRIISRAINGTAETTVFDAAGRVSDIANPLGNFAYAYDGPTTRLLSAAHDGGVKSVFSYFPSAQDHRLQRIANLKPNGTPLSQFDYQYDPQGRITEWRQQKDSDTVGATVWNLSYDAAHQLIGNRVTQGATTTSSAWTYDPAGNQLSATVGSETNTKSYNALNQLTATSLTEPEASYEWDAEDRLTAVVRGANRSEFTYDGLSRRVRIVEKTNGTVSSDTTYLGDGLQIRERRDATGATVQQRYFSQGFQGVTGAGTGMHLYTSDHLGSVRDVVDAAGALQERIDYDAWGQPTKLGEAPLTSFAFTSHLWHASSGLHLAPYRAYSANQGRWISRDPINESDGPNLYSYVNSNPIAYSDAFGLSGGVCPIPATFTSPAPLPPPGRCTTYQHRFLQDKVDEACSTARACKQNHTESELWERQVLFFNCIAARNAINNICFEGGDKNHQNEVKKEKAGRQNCLDLYEKIYLKY